MHLEWEDLFWYREVCTCWLVVQDLFVERLLCTHLIFFLSKLGWNWPSRWKFARPAHYQFYSEVAQVFSSKKDDNFYVLHFSSKLGGSSVSLNHWETRRVNFIWKRVGKVLFFSKIMNEGARNANTHILRKGKIRYWLQMGWKRYVSFSAGSLVFCFLFC